MAKLMQELEAARENPNVQRYLSMLRAAEGTAKAPDPYRVAGGGKVTLTDLSTYSPVKWGFKQTDGKNNASTAAGAYQFLSGTWADIQENTGLRSFDARSQDLGAIYLMQRSGSLKDVLAGNYKAAVSKDNKTWASLPGAPYPQKKRSEEFVDAALGIPREPRVRELPNLLSQAPTTAPTPTGPVYTPKQERLRSRAELAGLTPDEQEVANRVIMGLPEDTVPDYFNVASGLPTVLDDELTKLIETA